MTGVQWSRQREVTHLLNLCGVQQERKLNEQTPTIDPVRKTRHSLIKHDPGCICAG